MKVVIFSTDRKIFEKGSAVRERMIQYGALVVELYIVVYSRGESLLNDKIGENIWVYPTRSVSKMFYVSDGVRIANKILKERGATSTLITAQDPFETGLTGYIVSRQFSLPLQLQIHTDFLNPYFKRGSVINKLRVSISTILIKRATSIRVVSERIKKSLLDRNLVSEEKITVLPIFVDISKKINVSHNVFLKEKYPNFNFFALMVSRLEKEKNMSLAIRAFSDAKMPEGSALIIVGSGSEEVYLKTLVRQLKIEDRVIFEGWVSNPEPYFQSADVFLSSSDYEGYGMSLIEAAAYGLPILSTDVGVVHELISEEVGAIVPVGDIKSFSEKLQWAAQHPQEIKSWGEKTREVVKMRFLTTLESYLSRYRLAWEKCVI